MKRLLILLFLPTLLLFAGKQIPQVEFAFPGNTLQELTAKGIVANVIISSNGIDRKVEYKLFYKSNEISPDLSIIRNDESLSFNLAKPKNKNSNEYYELKFPFSKDNFENSKLKLSFRTMERNPVYYVLTYDLSKHQNVLKFNKPNFEKWQK
jgi:hypothetical protein